MVNTHFHCVANGKGGFAVTITPETVTGVTVDLSPEQLSDFITMLRTKDNVTLDELTIHMDRTGNLKFAEYLELVLESAKEAGYV